MTSGVTLETLNSLKSSATPMGRLYNWNLIKTVLGSYGISLGDDEKNLIVAGDHQIIIDLLKTIKNEQVTQKASN